MGQPGWQEEGREEPRENGALYGCDQPSCNCASGVRNPWPAGPRGASLPLPTRPEDGARLGDVSATAPGTRTADGQRAAFLAGERIGLFRALSLQDQETRQRCRQSGPPRVISKIWIRLCCEVRYKLTRPPPSPARPWSRHLSGTREVFRRPLCHSW